jgi:osmoprotectant transport system permease protein
MEEFGMKKAKLKVKLTLLALCLMFACLPLSGCNQAEPDIVIGAKDFTEQHILGQMLVLLINRNTDLTAQLDINLASDVIFASVRTDVIDLYVEYTGTIYGSFLERSETKEPQEVFDISAAELSERYDLRVRPPLGFNNTFALAVSRETAETHGLVTISDLAEVSRTMIFGGSREILSRNDGIPNLKREYNMSFAEERVIDGADRYFAVVSGEVQVVEVFSTDGMLAAHDLVVLRDDLNFFPPYEGVVVIRGEIADRFPQIVEQTDRLIGVLNNTTMRELNYRADVLGESPAAIAERFLRTVGLI